MATPEKAYRQQNQNNSRQDGISRNYDNLLAFIMHLLAR
jgi:hypothetical protein